MYKLELKKKGKIIKSVDDWYNAAPPKNPSLHWKDGRSAKELAKYMTSTKGYMPEEIENILTKLGCTQTSHFMVNQKQSQALKVEEAVATMTYCLFKEMKL